MSTATAYPHIVVADDGTARIGDTRYKVEQLLATCCAADELANKATYLPLK